MNAKSYFTDHPSKTEVFETSDGLLFHQDGDAALHAKTLKDKEITMHKRMVTMKEDAEIVTEPSITELKEHKVKGAEDIVAPMPAMSIQPPVSEEVKEALEVAETATGEPVTSTEDQSMPLTTSEDPTVQTAEGKTVANKTQKTKSR